MEGDGFVKGNPEDEAKTPKMEGRSLFIFNQTTAADGTPNEEPTMKIKTKRDA